MKFGIIVPRNRSGDACTNETRAATSGPGSEGKGPVAPWLKQTVKRSNFCNCVHFFDKHEVFIAFLIFWEGEGCRKISVYKLFYNLYRLFVSIHRDLINAMVCCMCGWADAAANNGWVYPEAYQTNTFLLQRLMATPPPTFLILLSASKLRLYLKTMSLSFGVSSCKQKFF